MEREPQLREVQAWLAWKLTHSSKKEPKPRCLKAIADLKPLSRERRIQIYSNAYILRLLEVLHSDFEITTRALGKEQMHRLVQEFLWKYPSKFRNISNVGSRLPLFLKSHKVSKHLPFLPDVAQLEWLFTESYLAPDSVPLSQEEIAALAPQMQDAVFTLAPSLRLMASNWNIYKVWERRKASEKKFFTLPPKERTHLLIWRNQGDPEPMMVAGPAYKMLHLMKRGTTFGNILDAMKNVPDLENCLQEWFKDWMGKGLLVRGNDRIRAVPG